MENQGPCRRNWKLRISVAANALAALAIAVLVVVALITTNFGIGSFRAFREEQERSAELVQALEAYQRLGGGECPNIQGCADEFIHHLAQADVSLNENGRASLAAARKAAAHIRAEQMLAALERRVLNSARPISSVAARDEIITARMVLAEEGLTIEDIGYSSDRLALILGIAMIHEAESAWQSPNTAEPFPRLGDIENGPMR